MKRIPLRPKSKSVPPGSSKTNVLPAKRTTKVNKNKKEEEAGPSTARPHTQPPSTASKSKNKKKEDTMTVPFNPNYPSIVKNAAQFEKYVKILQRAIEHPTIKPKLDQSVHLHNCLAYENTQLLPNEPGSMSALRSLSCPETVVELIGGSLASRIEGELKQSQLSVESLTDNCRLVTSNRHCDAIIRFLRLVRSYIRRSYKRVKQIHKSSARRPTGQYRVTQFFEFIREVRSVIVWMLVSCRTFALTTTAGLIILRDLIQDPTSIDTLCIKTLYAKFPSQETVNNSKTKTLIGLEASINTYKRLQRVGFARTWVPLEVDGPAMEQGEEVRNIMIYIINSFSHLTALASDLLEIFRALIYADNTEKTFLLIYLNQLEKPDQTEISHLINALDVKVRKIFELSFKIERRASRGIKRFGPTPSQL